MRVNPDLDFIKYMKTAGGDTLKKCYQCATCSVVCPLSSDDNPFPRREMVWAQWGLKDKLVTDANVLLCHQCGDCTAYCPRGAKPGDVLGAIRAYLYTNHGFPNGLAKMVADPSKIAMTIGLPAIIIAVMWFISGGMHLPTGEYMAEHGFGSFFGHWDWPWLSKNVAFIDMIMLPAVGLAVYSSYRGAKALWTDMEKNRNVSPDFRPSAKQMAVEFFWPAIKETLEHKRFRECTENKDRERGHKPLMWAFIGLAIVTAYSAFKQDVLGIFIPSMHGPLALYDPFKILANVSAIAMVIGIGILWGNRGAAEEASGAKPTYYDWFLIYEIMAVAVTGIGSELCRLIGIPALAYFMYYLHLVAVLMLFLYMPYTKFAHLVYRTVAMAFERYSESGFVKK
ncbi:MAG: quinone-interacting membrane-bound oxidoreductase complex subunit QmoC [Thermodesulfobacteriota bacterium]